MRTRSTPILISLVAVVVLALGLAAPAAAQDEARPSGRQAVRTFAVYHGPVEVALAGPASDGHQLGDLRVTSVETTDANGNQIGRLEATLTTTSVDVPASGDEARSGTLVFTFGEAAETQIVVQGSAHYPGEGSTIATGETTVRPIVGGSGRFAGASGEAATSHLDDGTWVHEFDFRRSGASRALERAMWSRLREGLRERRDGARERELAKVERELAQIKRKQARAERKTERKTGRGDDAVDELYTAAADQTGVVRTDLGIASPGSASGEWLGLWHYLIPAGAELAPHTHPGWQLARITAGELEYSIISGEGELLRADGSMQPMGPGTYLLASGDGVIENPELVHFGANRTDEAVTLISATLFEADASIATLVEDESVADEAAPADEEVAAASPAA